MHKFWYHSPVRFYRTLEELQDVTNPQNTQYFGEFKPYPLEINDFHRYIIPNYQNTAPNDDLRLYVVNDKEEYQVQAIFKVIDGILKYVTFKSIKSISGRFEIRDSDNNTLFYSNCIEFLDSTDEIGRKFIKVATKHTYNRGLFDFQGVNSWIVTNLPAYSLGLNSVEAEINNARTGGISTLKTRETYIDELTEYEFVAGGDSNILNFIQVHVTNNEFYIDGTKRTSIDKIDRDEFSILGKLRLTNVKDLNGFNIIVPPNILTDIYDSIYADDINYNYTYSHEPINEVNSGDEFLANLLFNNYHNPFGIIYDSNLRIIIKSVPIKGFLADNITKQIYTIDSVISYTNKDNLVYYPNGFDNDLGISGNFIENFTYRIIDQGNRTGKLISHKLTMTDSAAPEIDLSASISWDDNTSTPKSGNLPNIIVKVVSIIFDPLDPIVTQEWQTFDGADWIFYKTKTTDSENFALPILENKIRLKVVSSFGEIAYSNNLVYTKSSTSSIFITDIVGGLTGYTTYKLHVEVEAFNGYVVLQGEKNLNGKNANLSDTLGGSLIIPNTKAIGEFVTSAEAITIPVGVYDCVFEANAIPKNSGVTLEVNGLVGYGYTTDIYDSIASAQVNLLIEP